jgi:hypothetical protein
MYSEMPFYGPLHYLDRLGDGTPVAVTVQRQPENCQHGRVAKLTMTVSIPYPWAAETILCHGDGASIEASLAYLDHQGAAMPADHLQNMRELSFQPQVGVWYSAFDMCHDRQLPNAPLWILRSTDHAVVAISPMLEGIPNMDYWMLRTDSLPPKPPECSTFHSELSENTAITGLSARERLLKTLA